MKVLYNSFLLLVIVLFAGCNGRPPVPVSSSNYSNSRTSPAISRTNASSKRPPLPSKRDENAQDTKPIRSDAALSGQEIFKKCNTAVFMIFTSTGYEEYQGSGFFITSDGLAVSNYHVFEGTGVGLESIKLADDSRYKLDEVIFKDKENDVMIFRVVPKGRLG